MPKKKTSLRTRLRALRPRSWRGLLLKLTIAGLVPLLIFFAYCDAQVRDAFASDRYDQPAKVYARPLVLASGAVLTAYELEEELRNLGYRRLRMVSEPGSYRREGDTFTIYLRPFDFARSR